MGAKAGLFMISGEPGMADGSEVAMIIGWTGLCGADAKLIICTRGQVFTGL